MKKDDWNIPSKKEDNDKEAVIVMKSLLEFDAQKRMTWDEFSENEYVKSCLELAEELGIEEDADDEEE